MSYELIRYSNRQIEFCHTERWTERGYRRDYYQWVFKVPVPCNSWGKPNFHPREFGEAVVREANRQLFRQVWSSDLDIVKRHFTTFLMSLLPFRWKASLAIRSIYVPGLVNIVLPTTAAKRAALAIAHLVSVAATEIILFS